MDGLFNITEVVSDERLYLTRRLFANRFDFSSGYHTVNYAFKRANSISILIFASNLESLTVFVVS